MKHDLELRSSNVSLSSIVEYPPHAQLVILVLPSKLYQSFNVVIRPKF